MINNSELERFTNAVCQIARQAGAYIREERSKQIREVRTVDNPFEPGTKIERPAFFKNSWINSRQDAILLSDSSLEPNIVRGLMEQGEWLPAN